VIVLGDCEGPARNPGAATLAATSRACWCDGVYGSPLLVPAAGGPVDRRARAPVSARRAGSATAMLSSKATPLQLKMQRLSCLLLLALVRRVAHTAAGVPVDRRARAPVSARRAGSATAMLSSKAPPLQLKMQRLSCLLLLALVRRVAHTAAGPAEPSQHGATSTRRGGRLRERAGGHRQCQKGTFDVLGHGSFKIENLVDGMKLVQT